MTAHDVQGIAADAVTDGPAETSAGPDSLLHGQMLCDPVSVPPTSRNIRNGEGRSPRRWRPTHSSVVDMETMAPAPVRALVVDDDPNVCHTVAAMLAARGYVVQEARLPSEAFQLAEAGNEFDLLVTDVILPEMTGLELARRLATQWPSLRVVYTSGYASGSVMAPGAVVAGSAFLTKPFLSSQLVQAAETALGLAAASAA